jgi:hypothetical protein
MFAGVDFVINVKVGITLLSSSSTHGHGWCGASQQVHDENAMPKHSRKDKSMPNRRIR